MRARNIKPGFWQNEDLAEMPPATRLAFIGLWCLADRDGKLEYRPKKIKLQLFPYDDVDIGHALSCLGSAGLILFYDVDHIQYIQIVNFKKHQSPHVRETASTIPDPVKGEPRTCLGSALDQPRSPDSLNPDSLNPEKNTCPNGHDYFEEFYKNYPRKVARGAAEKAWKKIKNPKETLGLIMSAISWQRRLPAWTEDGGKFIPYPSAYLNQKRWLDEPTINVEEDNIFARLAREQNA